MVMLRAAPSDGRRYDELLRANRTSPDRAPWWLPAMVHLAMAEPDVSEQARSVLRGWAARRFDFAYAVVQEETDDHLSLTASAWPLVDDRGRLRFRTTDDPVECHAERPELQAFVDGHRARWHALGLVGAEQATRPIRLGDVFAFPLVRVNGALIRLVDRPLRRSSTPAELFLVPSRSTTPELPIMDVVEQTETERVRRRKIASIGAPVIDITWDARQAGKVAQLAAYAGVLNATATGATTGAAPPSPPVAAPQVPIPDHRRPARDGSEEARPGFAGSEPEAAVGAPPLGADDELIAEGQARQLHAYLEKLEPDAALDLPADHTTGSS